MRSDGAYNIEAGWSAYGAVNHSRTQIALKVHGGLVTASTKAQYITQ